MHLFYRQETEFSMQPKPDYLGPEYGTAFQDSSVAKAYQYRPPFASATFDILTDLVVDTPRHVLDAGCGTGALARYLVERVDRVDAVDISQEMIGQGKSLPQGQNPRLNWIVGHIEDAPLQPPYALITAGRSLHWMDWYVVLPRFARMLTPNGYLAIVYVKQLPTPWNQELTAIRRRYTTTPDRQSHHQIATDVAERGLFKSAGTARTAPVTLSQTLDDYIESFHSQSSFSRSRMTPENAAAFDQELRALVAPLCTDTVEQQVVTEIVWGKPLQPNF
jgi:trans-aconitate methyltransferase